MSEKSFEKSYGVGSDTKFYFKVFDVSGDTSQILHCSEQRLPIHQGCCDYDKSLGLVIFWNQFVVNNFEGDTIKVVLFKKSLRSNKEFYNTVISSEVEK